MKILEINNLKKSFGGIKAINDFSLSIEQGDIHALIGPNGSGKTTLVNMISGLCDIEGGHVFFNQEKITGMPLHRLSQLGISRTFQNLEICRSMSVLDNVLLGFSFFLDKSLWRSALRVGSLSQKENTYRERAHQLIKDFGLEKYTHYLAGEMSYGNQKKLEIIRSLASNPQLLMLDEPVAGVGHQEKEELIEIIKHLQQLRKGESPITILLIEHNMKMVMELSDKVSVINFGIKLAEGSPEEIKNNPEVIEAYLGQSE